MSQAPSNILIPSDILDTLNTQNYIRLEATETDRVLSRSQFYKQDNGRILAIRHDIDKNKDYQTNVAIAEFNAMGVLDGRVADVSYHKGDKLHEKIAVYSDGTFQKQVSNNGFINKAMISMLFAEKKDQDSSYEILAAETPALSTAKKFINSVRNMLGFEDKPKPGPQNTL